MTAEQLFIPVTVAVIVAGYFIGAVLDRRCDRLWHERGLREEREMEERGEGLVVAATVTEAVAEWAEGVGRIREAMTRSVIDSLAVPPHLLGHGWFGDETADALFRTVLDRPADGAAKGALADRLDEVGPRWKWFAHAMRWCGTRGKWPHIDGDGRAAWYGTGCGEFALVPAALFSNLPHGHGTFWRQFNTPFDAYAAMAETLAKTFAEVEA